MTREVSFTQMKDGTAEDYELLAELEKPFHGLTAERIEAYSIGPGKNR